MVQIKRTFQYGGYREVQTLVATINGNIASMKFIFIAQSSENQARLFSTVSAMRKASAVPDSVEFTVEADGMMPVPAINRFG